MLKLETTNPALKAGHGGSHQQSLHIKDEATGGGLKL